VANWARLAAADDLGTALEVEELDVRCVAAELVAVLPPERGAAHHAAVGVGGVEPLPDRLEPRLPVVVVQRLASGHLRDVGRRVEVVGVRERHPQALGEGRADGRLAGTGHPHHDDDGAGLLG
jgi:hypothetical protein